MPKIFGKDASLPDFELVIKQLEEGVAVARKNSMNGSSIGKEMDDLKQTDEISESQLDHIIDESGGFLEDSPGRLTIPEIRAFRSQVSRFGDLANVLSKYGYSEAAVFKSLIQTDPGRYDIATKVLNQPDFQLTDLSPELRGDKHFMIALIQGNKIIYEQLSDAEKKDPDFALQYVRTKLLDNGVSSQDDLFDSVPDDLRLDSTFLQKFKETVTRDYGRNVIQPQNFNYVWYIEDKELLQYQWQRRNLDSLPPGLKDFQHWIDFYDGDQDQAFKATVNGNIIPRDVLENDFLTKENASEFYKQLPDELKVDDELSRIALAHDTKTFFYLPSGSQLLKEPETWFTAADAGGSYNDYGHPDFPKELLSHSPLVNKIVATHPELLDTYRENPKELKQILSQLTPENVVVFVSTYLVAFDLLPEALKHDLNFAKKVVDFKNYSQTAEKLFEIHGAELAIYEIRKDPEVISRIPKDVLSLPEVDQIVLEQIKTLSENEMPYWAQKYFEDHPDLLPDLIESKPDLFEELWSSWGTWGG